MKAITVEKGNHGTWIATYVPTKMQVARKTKELALFDLGRLVEKQMQLEFK